MKRLRNILLSGILSVGMIVASMPVELLAQEAVLGQGESETQEHSLYKIVSFEELTEEVKNRNVPVQTALEELELPETLTVSYRPYTEKQNSEEETDQNPEDNSGEEGEESISGDDTGDEGKESISGDDTGDEEKEEAPSDGVEEEGEKKEETPDGGVEEEGGEKEETPGGDTGEEGKENTPGGDAGEEETKDTSGDGGEESENVPADDSAEEMVQKTVEVHMEEYKSQPEIVVGSGTLTPDGEETGGKPGDANTATDADADANTGTNSDTNKSPDTEASPDEDYDISQGVETAVIENITWLSNPAYDGSTEGCYLFTPVLPEEYVVGDGVALPEIAVTVGEVLAPVSEEVVGTPGFGTISVDTVWKSAGKLKNGEIIVEPGVTLTINNCISIMGKVTIKGGGTIKRGSAGAYFYIIPGADLTVGEITLDGNSILADDPLLAVYSAKVLLDDGCRIQNCYTRTWMGGVMYMTWGEAVLNNVTITNCNSVASSSDIGAITMLNSSMTINGGTYKDNKASGYFTASLIYSHQSKLYVYGGTFINNVVNNSLLGGCILDLGQTGNETHIYGGYFEGNKSTSDLLSGGGAITYVSRRRDGDKEIDENTIFELVGDVQFCGDGVEGSGIDGIALDFWKFPRKIYVGSPIISPVYLSLNAKEGYVIAKGSDNGYILTEKDMKQIHFTDVGDSGKQWYAWLDKENNEVILSEKQPPYGLYVHYSSNGATGKVEDNTEYTSGTDVTVKSADALSMKGYTFKEWNTKPNGTGTPYSPGSSFKITDDITLYAIFRQNGSINASFYSGGADRKEVKSAEVAGGAESVTITVPELKDMDTWTKVGWDEKTDSYAGVIAPGDSLTLSKDTSYYGIYKKDITLSYDANGGKIDDLPKSEARECRANVHDKITCDMPTFSVAKGISANDSEWEFAGWNTKPDGKGDFYSEGYTIKTAEDITLYAIFIKPPFAYFYSGNVYSGKAEYEKRGGSVVTGKVTAPRLKEKTGWEAIGWDAETAGHGGSIKPGEEFTLALEEDGKKYYGVYEKTVTLTYILLDSVDGAGGIFADRSQTRRAKVCETEIRYDSGANTPENPDAFVFDIRQDDPVLDGYEFLGWSTSPDGEDGFYRKDDAERNQIMVTKDTVLYGIFGILPSAAFYSGAAGQYETVKSAFAGDAGSGTLTTPKLKEMEGWEAVGWSKSVSGYAESLEIEADRDIAISEDTSFYGVYKKDIALSYDANGWEAAIPDGQSQPRYANVHNEITYSNPPVFTVGKNISREGYTFRGWSPEREAGGVCYMPEDTVTLEESAVLYAQMVDDIAPVLGEAVYNSGYRNIKNWIVRKRDLVITVPVTEKGSGVEKIVYTFTPEGGEPVMGEARPETAGESVQAGELAKVRLEVGTADGQIQAKITVSEDYKGAISLLCRDNAGNESPLKLLTAEGGGVIVEDNAPQISFRQKEIKNSRARVEVTVYDNAGEGEDSRISGGIASVNYEIDNKQTQSVTDKGFAEEIVETCTFEVEVTGVGEHTIKVAAVDNAGNESSRQTSVRIDGNKKQTTVIKSYSPPRGGQGEPAVYEPPVEETVKSAVQSLPTEVEEPEPPEEREPKTQDCSPGVAVYATIAMISGLLYILLYFTTEQSGMTEADKNEAVGRLIAWAKKGGKLRRYLALAAILCVLVYYHSIGKNVTVESRTLRSLQGS